MTAPKRGRPKGRVVGSWRARAEAAGVPMATFRREALAEAFLKRCPFAREWTRNSVYRAAEGLHRTPSRYHAELIERAREISGRAEGPDIPAYDDPQDGRWNRRDPAHADAASVIAWAWDGERLVTVWSKRGHNLRHACLYVPNGGAAAPSGTVNPPEEAAAKARRVSVSNGSLWDPSGTVIEAHLAHTDDDERAAARGARGAA